MNIEEKYRIKYLISLFTHLHKQLITKGNPEYMDSDPEMVEWVDNMLEKTYGYKDQNERDYLFAAFMKNFYATGGEFDKLGESVKPLTPKLTTFKIVEDEWCEVRITNYYNVETYSESQATSLLYNGWLDPDDSLQDVIECHDRDILIKEVTSKEETIEEDLEYWKTDSEGPEDDEYGMGPS
jgi:hypothetical protein|tara:strand:- start:657 stop:1202 length:546 start_codon:yes stop_codon:yes gene_type:complete